VTGDLRASNRRILAERLHWPDGALQACVELEGRHPGWDVSWSHENTIKGFEHPARFSANYDDAAGGGMHKLAVFAETAEELEPLLIEVPEHSWGWKLGGCAWCRAQLS
jgi:hypothetical protein